MLDDDEDDDCITRFGGSRSNGTSEEALGAIRDNDRGLRTIKRLRI